MYDEMFQFSENYMMELDAALTQFNVPDDNTNDKYALPDHLAATAGDKSNCWDLYLQIRQAVKL